MKKLILLTAVAALAACSDNNDNDPIVPAAPADVETPAPVTPAAFEITTTNLTVAQPLSPIAALVHAEDISVFQVGSPASEALEILAEGGDNSELLASVDSAAAIGSEGPLGPGGTEVLNLELADDNLTGLQLSVVTMLVNTNDAFTAVNGLDLSGMAAGDSVTLNTISYDSGTEANTEAAADIPGPAGGGEGFNPTRDDIRDQVTMHGGVVTEDDGLVGSALEQSHRWDNPTARITITRVQ